MPHDVFISHSSLDRDAAYALCESLEAAQVPCWIAPRDIPAGSDWQGEIMEAISGTKMMLVLFSQNGNASANVSKEVTAAADARVPIIPVRLDDTPPSATLRYHLSGVHWLDAYPPPLDGHLSRIADLVRGRVARLAPQAPRPAPAAAPEAAPAAPPAARPTPAAPTAPAAAAPTVAQPNPFAGAAPARAPEPVARQAQGPAAAGAGASAAPGYVAAGGGAAAATPGFDPFAPSAPAPKGTRGQWLLIGGILGGLVLLAVLLLMFTGPRNNGRPPVPGQTNQQLTTPPPDLEVTTPGSVAQGGPVAPNPDVPTTPNNGLAAQEASLTALFQQVRAQQADPTQLDETEQQFQAARTACNGDVNCLTPLYASRRSILEGYSGGGDSNDGNGADAGDEGGFPAVAE
jgi:hypothetical protein